MEKATGEMVKALICHVGIAVTPLPDLGCIKDQLMRSSDGILFAYRSAQ